MLPENLSMLNHHAMRLLGGGLKIDLYALTSALLVPHAHTHINYFPVSHISCLKASLCLTYMLAGNIPVPHTLL